MPARFAKVDDNVYRGGAPSYRDLLMLKDLGITQILSLDGNVAQGIAKACKHLGFKHNIIPIHGLNPNIDKLKQSLNKILNKDEVTYVHCLHGKDRTGMTCAMYRISHGGDLYKALLEAAEFGMGSHLSEDVKKMYYDNVVKFYHENKDKNDASTISDTQRDALKMERDNNVVSLLTTVSDPSTNAFSTTMPSFAPYSPSHDSLSPMMNVLAGEKIWTISKPTDLLKGDKVWGSRTLAMNNLSNEGKLYSADISSDAKIIKFRTYFNRALLQSAKLQLADVVIFYDLTFVINPNALINIEDASDVNNADLPIVGRYDTYTGQKPMTDFDSLLEDGSGGFAGMHFPTYPTTY